MVAGFLVLRGRCRGCGVEITRRYLAGEVTGGAFWANAVVRAGPVVRLTVVVVVPLMVLLGSPLRDGSPTAQADCSGLARCSGARQLPIEQLQPRLEGPDDGLDR